MSRVSVTRRCVCRQLLLMLRVTLWSLWLCRSAGVASVGARKPRRQQKRRESRQRQPGEQHGGLQQGKRGAPPHTWFIDQLLHVWSFREVRDGLMMRESCTTLTSDPCQLHEASHISWCSDGTDGCRRLHPDAAPPVRRTVTDN